jgi:uncharacterized membrane-anchored protein YhcB (DUF1043 family)
MGDLNLIEIGVGIVVSIIGFYLKSTMSSLKKVEEKTYEHNTQIEILKQNHTELEKKFDSIVEMIKDISKDIKHLTIQIERKKDRE